MGDPPQLQELLERLGLELHSIVAGKIFCRAEHRKVGVQGFDQLGSSGFLAEVEHRDPSAEPVCENWPFPLIEQ